MNYSIFSVIVALFFTLHSAHAAFPKFVHALPKGTLKTNSDAAGFFSQRLDHFDSVNTQTFKQRYFVDSTLAKGDQAPVIYYMCGEGTCEGATGTPLVDEVAKKYGAHRVALEHRFYGHSVPLNTLASSNLKYLSMDQALEDLAAFQKHARDVLGLKGKWIAVGGSYAGELAAFYRLKHPELIVGALASSAPVLAKANFEEYDRHVAKVAGPECLQAIQAAVLDAEARLKNSESATALKKLFQLETIRDDRDFLYVMADMASFAVQYGFQKTFCDGLKEGVQKNKLIETYASVGVSILARFGITPLQDSFQGAESTDPKDYLSFAGMRSWMYQSCTEFGFYQIAYSVPAQSMRSTRIDMPYHNEVCNRLFGLTVPVNTDRTNAKYYNQLLNQNVTNIYFTNGANDPWSNLSMSESDAARNPNLMFSLIPNAAHCDDLGSDVSGPLTMVRNQFTALVKKWLSE